MKFEVVQSDLTDALADCLLAAGTNQTLPMLCTVFLEGAEGDQHVTLTATDKFMLVHRRINTVEPLTEDMSALIPADQAKMLVGIHKAAARAARRGPPPEPIAVDVAPNYLTVGSVSVPLDTDHEYVKYRSLLPKTVDAEIDVLPIDLAFLVKASKMSAYHKGRGVRLRFAGLGVHSHDTGQPPRLIVIEYPERTDDTTVLVMPMRIPG